MGFFNELFSRATIQAAATTVDRVVGSYVSGKVEAYRAKRRAEQAAMPSEHEEAARYVAEHTQDDT